ncbi:MAG: hypothetical protein NWP69_06395, partial [Congregibacter sp.]|nr:hypothetical protein [Congregibacter sp.]
MLAGLALVASVSMGSISAAAAAATALDAQIERGAYLTKAGNCVSCHTREGGKPMAGGLAFETPFGTLYS